MVNKQTSIWSERFNFKFGWHWVLEQVCSIDESKQLLDTYKRAEMSTVFKISKYRPPRNPKWIKVP